MGVGVDDPRGQHQAVGVDLLTPGSDLAADLDDAAAGDREGAAHCGRLGAVDEKRVPDDEVVHGAIIDRSPAAAPS